jgi:lipopolysaccharide heptosyltransferase II
VKILVRATNWVGDAVMSIPALEAIRARWPEAEITILARSHVAGLYRGQQFADRLLVVESAAGRGGLLAVERLAAALRRERFDVGIVLPNSFASAWLLWRAGAAERVGYARDGRGWLLTRAVALPRAQELPAHETYGYCELLRRAGWLESLPQVERIGLPVSPAAREQAREKLARLGGESRGQARLRVALASGAVNSRAKRWPPERYAELADRLVDEFGAAVVLFGAASEREVTRRIEARMRHRPIDLAGQTTIEELPALLAACDLFIGNDSGAAHVAAAVGLPVVVVFGPTDPERTRPLSPRATVVREPVSCSPCLLRDCPVDHRCMDRVSVEKVYAAARRWISNEAGRE